MQGRAGYGWLQNPSQSFLAQAVASCAKAASGSNASNKAAAQRVRKKMVISLQRLLLRTELLMIPSFADSWCLSHKILLDQA
jgi:hypothetical protein